MSFARVLIIGEYFDLKSGGGITMTNLFKGWDKDKLAVAAEGITNPDFSVCVKNYQLGKLENKRRFPFNLKIRRDYDRSGPLDIKAKVESNYSSPEKESKYGKIYDSIIDYSGLVHYRNKLIISENLFTWIKEFSPDYIYSQLSSYSLIVLVSKLHEMLGIPVAIHIMDDWPASISQKGLMKSYWNKKIDNKFRNLLSNSKVLLSISESMSEAYQIRYGQKFTPFHNPIELGDWLPYAKNDWSIKGVFKVLYTGRLGTANNKSILFISNVISLINQAEIKIKLDIYSQDAHRDSAELIRAFKGVEVMNTVPYKRMPALLASYDLLFLPLDFDEEGINFARYSMPTKASEYMISGTPILVFADMQTALAKYAAREGWAYVVSENNVNALTVALNQLVTDQALRISIAEKAKKTVVQNEDAIIVREKFRRCFIIE